MAQTHLRVAIKFAWWVKPLIHPAKFNASLGIEVDVDRLTQIILKRRVRYKFA